ncbi:MAG: TetR family transcriptional regulator C-terminal domain-containing protein [Bernardetiaceae bacterium]|jgi:hypothetical protein|nr:TetR family transcriptional regulator C-terminal domain-containing protein [Bernardetiaceae bacterium]
MTQLQQQYIDYLLTHRRRPASVYAFAKTAGLDERAFYEECSSFAQLEAQIWADALGQTLGRITQDEVYNNYTAREKVLTLYYALLEQLKAVRSFAVFTLDREPPLFGGELLKPFRAKFDEHIKSVINDGVYSGEVNDRPFLTDRYADLIWWQVLFLLRFWAKDTSPDFERTDAAVEKAVNLSFDLLGRNLLDSAFDFGKFVLGK